MKTGKGRSIGKQPGDTAGSAGRSRSAVKSGEERPAPKDSAERRGSERQEVRELFDAVAQSMLDGMAIVDWEGSVLFANRAAYHIVGLRPRRNPVGFTMAQVIHPDDLPRAFEDHMQARKGRGGFLAQYRIVTPKGTVKWIEVIGQKVTFRGTEANLVTFRDISRRRHDEETLKKSREQILLSRRKYAQAYHSSPLAISISELSTGTYIDMNRAYEALTGFTRKELIGRSVLDTDLWGDPADRERYLGVLESHGNLSGFEARLRRKDGTKRDVVLSSSIIKVGGERYLQSLVHDVTDQKRMERALMESEERYRRITRAITDYIYTVYLEQGNVVRTVHSPACEAVTGYKPEDFYRDEYLWYSMIEEEDRELVREHFNRVTRGERVHPIEHRIRRKDGSIRWVSNMPVIHRDAQGTMISYDGVVSDITERKLAEQELKESEERFRNLHDASFGGIGIHDKGVILDCNQGLTDITGYSRDELIGMDGLNLIAPAWRESVMDKIVRGYDQPYEVEGIRKDGTVYPLEIRGKNIPYHGRVVRVTEFRDVTERTLIEAALRESEERYRLMTELTGKLVYDYDVSSGRMTWHGALTQLTGFLPEEFVAVDMKTWNSMIHPEDRGETMTILESALKACGPYHAEYRVRRKDGSYIFVEDHGVFLPDVAGNAYRVLGSIGDITVRKKADEALRESEERYHSMFEKSHAVMLLIEPDTGRIVDANPAACAFYGYSKHELVARNITEINTLEPDEVFAEMEEARSMRKRGFVFRHRLADGTTRDVEVFSGPIAIGGRTFLHSIVHDITDRRRAEEALRESEGRFRSLIQNSTDIIVILDGNGTITYETPSLSRILGYADGLVGRSPLDFMHPDDVERVAHDLGEVYQGINVGIPTEFRFRRADGSWVHLEAVGSNLMGYPGINGLVITARDITERKKAEDIRIEMERRMLHAQRLESLGVMAGGIAHDFNNLLMAILGNLDLAQLDLSPVSRSRPFIDHAIVAARRAADLTNQMLAYSGKGRFDLKTFDMSELVEEMSHLLKASISKTVTISLQITHGLPSIKADPGQIQQIIMNLIVNASEAIGDAPGVIVVRTGAMTCTGEYLEGSRIKEKPQPGEYVFFEVEDTGCGMGEDTLDRLFDPFFTTKFTGRGLGLAAVSGIITGHKGAIMVSSEPGRGTTIRVLLPVSPEQPRGMAGERAKKERMVPMPNEQDLPGGMVLVVDDEEMVRDLCRSMVERLGYPVVTATDGEDAVRIFRENAREIICVLLDLTMPRKDGMETLDELKRMNEKVKVILSSGFDEQDITERFRGKGLAGFIKKPYRFESLKEELERVLGRA